MMALCLMQYCDPWAAKIFLVVLAPVLTENGTPKRWKIFFLVNKFLLAENVVKGPGQYKFGPAYSYHLSLVTKNIIKVYEQWLVILFAFWKFICVY